MTDSKMIRTGLLAGVLGFLFLSCATKPSAYQEVDDAVHEGTFQAGVEAINKRQFSRRPLYPERNAVAYYLDKGMLEHYAGNYAESSRNLEEAELLIEEAYTRSITADVASYIANDNTKDYAGEDFEDIYINVFNALNYYKQGNIEGALVEIRKLILSSGKLDMLSRKYEAGGKSAGDWIMQQLGMIGFTLSESLPQGEPVAYSGSALAQYLSALFFLADGNADSARIAFNAVREAFAANPNIYDYPVPKAVAEARNVPAGMARLNVIAFAGLSPIKGEKRLAQNWAFMQNAELQNPVFKLPVFVDRDSAAHRVSVTVNGETFDLELIEDMGAVAKETYKAKFSNVFLKTYIRVLLKYAAADIAATQAGNTPGGDIARLATANAARVAVNASESADIRMGRYFPNKAYVGGINLEPGSYPVTINFSSGAIKELVVDIQANSINLVDAVSLTPNVQTALVNQTEETEALTEEEAEQRLEAERRASMRESFYRVTKNGALNGFTGSQKNIIIPSTIRGMPVNTIRNGVFSDKNLVSVTIPDNIRIRGTAFRDNQLVSITIGANVWWDEDRRPFNNGFERVYLSNRRTAGTYTRPDTDSTVWTKQ